ncbi:F-box/kelch-repeat protein At3g06240-like [Quercus robur]|uniref:F-box/kelch-repeat protein At3g06240-like n=1 Tax=Quercus robur TaxID=38942 RepID=UPI0021619632|nr:F-box/kelch-repeat protein At3g06240-like [Quercus robur]
MEGWGLKLLWGNCDAHVKAAVGWECCCLMELMLVYKRKSSPKDSVPKPEKRYHPKLYWWLRPTFNRISEYPIPSGFFPSHYSYTADSCNGLVCFTNHNDLPTNTGAIYLWNPSIRKLKRLPGFSQTQYLSFCTGFAYQSNTNDFKVVKISQMPGMKTEAEVYTLSSNSWRRVEISLANAVLGVDVDNQTATFVSGALHWLGNVVEGASLFMILSFNVNNDKFGEIALPHAQQQQLLPQGVMAKINRLMVFKGKLAFITLGYLRFEDANLDEYNGFMTSHTPRSCFIWVMGDRGELLVIKKLNPESNTERRFTVVSLDLETSREKDLGFQKVPDIATTFMESLVLLDGATELSG